MKTVRRNRSRCGCFAVGFGMGLALVSAFVIVMTEGLQPSASRPRDVVRLAPVTVRIAPQAFDMIRFAAASEPVVSVPNDGPGRG